MTILSIIKELKSNSSRLAKEAILTREKDNKLLQKFFRLSLDPYINFYMKKEIVVVEAPNRDYPLDQAFNFIENTISKREITGNEAINRVAHIMGMLSPEDCTVLQMVLKKNPDCGVQEATVNKIWKGMVPTYPCLLASAYDEKLVNKLFADGCTVYAQLKSDGLRCNIIIDENGGVTLFSRNGKELDVLGAFDHFGKHIKNVMIDGELLTIDTFGKFNNRQTSNGICSKAIKGTMSFLESKMLHLVAWDIVPLSDFKSGKCLVQYDDRLRNLINFIDCTPTFTNMISLSPSKVVKSVGESWEFYDSMIADGQEGAIIKSGSMIWEDKRSKLQVKMKAEEESDLEVIGFKEGTGRFTGNLGSLEVATCDRKIVTNISGFTDKQRAQIYASLTNSNVEYEVSAQDENGNSIRKINIASPGESTIKLSSIVAVKYNQKIQEKNGTWSLFLPRFEEERVDKTCADSFDQVK